MIRLDRTCNCSKIFWILLFCYCVGVLALEGMSNKRTITSLSLRIQRLRRPSVLTTAAKATNRPKCRWQCRCTSSDYVFVAWPTQGVPSRIQCNKVVVHGPSDRGATRPPQRQHRLRCEITHCATPRREASRSAMCVEREILCTHASMSW